jgi:hypothetical protein
MGKMNIVRTVVFMLLAVAVTGGIAGTMPLAKNPPKIQMEASRSRRTTIEGGDYDDKLQKVQLEIVVKNLDLNKKVEGMTVHFWAFGQSQLDRKAYKVIDAGEFPIALDGTPEGREVRHQCEEIKLAWDNTDVKFGQAYKGYLLVMTNAQNEVVAVKSNVQSWQAGFEKAFELKKGSWCGLDFKPTKAPKY